MSVTDEYQSITGKYIQLSTHPKVLHGNWMSDDETIHEKLQGNCFVRITALPLQLHVASLFVQCCMKT